MFALSLTMIRILDREKINSLMVIIKSGPKKLFEMSI